MNRAEYLLTCLAEECDEVGQRVCKALRFSLSEVQPEQEFGHEFDNAERIVLELEDLLAVAKILRDERVLRAPVITPDLVARKLNKIERFMAISREQGTLQ